MARQDIQIDTQYGELETTDNIVGKNIYDFTLSDMIEGENNDGYCYAEITLPQGYEKRVKEGFQAHVCIPYSPWFKQLNIRFAVQTATGTEYMRNPRTNREWYVVTLPSGEPIYLSELRKVSESGEYNLILYQGGLLVYSGHETDLLIQASLSQNQTFLLKASAGILYQHPLTGVGLVDFLHGNFENSGLAAKLQKEFEADNMIVVNAYMNSETGELLLEVKEKNG